MDFYPRPLRRGRHSAPISSPATQSISIHALFAEGDPHKVHRLDRLDISIHALFAEGDAPALGGIPARRHFYPRPLRRGRQRICQCAGDVQSISIHALFAEGDR